MPEPVQKPTKERRSKPGLLYTLIAARPISVGKLVDFANAIPDEWIVETAAALGASIAEDYRSNRRRASRRRRLVILGALLTRLTFDVEQVPRHRDEII